MIFTDSIISWVEQYYADRGLSLPHANSGLGTQQERMGAESRVKVVRFEYRSNNHGPVTVAHLACGHERVFEYGHYPKAALCWECSRSMERN